MPPRAEPAACAQEPPHRRQECHGGSIPPASMQGVLNRDNHSQTGNRTGTPLARRLRRGACCAAFLRTHAATGRRTSGRRRGSSSRFRQPTQQKVVATRPHRLPGSAAPRPKWSASACVFFERAPVDFEAPNTNATIKPRRESPDGTAPEIAHLPMAQADAACSRRLRCAWLPGCDVQLRGAASASGDGRRSLGSGTKVAATGRADARARAPRLVALGRDRGVSRPFAVRLTNRGRDGRR
jgi:hypothetical protein